MKRDKEERGTWSRREVFRVGSMATAAGVIGRVGCGASSRFDRLRNLLCCPVV